VGSAEQDSVRGTLSLPFPASSAMLPRLAAGFRREDMSGNPLGIDFAKQGGLVPVIVQDADDGCVLMLAYMNEAALAKTLETRKATYWSRSRSEFWVKGKSSGNVQEVEEVLFDCDSDTILLKVRQLGGAACHEGYRSCFFRRVEDGGFEVVGKRVFDPAKVYKK
jgi:phosphoribosyl-AMP cyclohydrolase